MRFVLLPLVVGLLQFCVPVPAQDSVTVPKSRLEELERKEQELEKLKGDVKSTKSENTELKKQHVEDQTKIEKLEPVVHVSPPMESLPALARGEVVDALDLANHYIADSKVADARYANKRFLLRGEITGFSRTVFVRPFKVLLKSTNRDCPVKCEFFPPPAWRSVITTKDGSELVAVKADESRARIARVGDTVLITGTCEGKKADGVIMSATEIKVEGQ